MIFHSLLDMNSLFGTVTNSKDPDKMSQHHRHLDYLLRSECTLGTELQYNSNVLKILTLSSTTITLKDLVIHPSFSIIMLRKRESWLLYLIVFAIVGCLCSVSLSPWCRG